MTPEELYAFLVRLEARFADALDAADKRLHRLEMAGAVVAGLLAADASMGLLKMILVG